MAIRTSKSRPSASILDARPFYTARTGFRPFRQAPTASRDRVILLYCPAHLQSNNYLFARHQRNDVDFPLQQRAETSRRSLRASGIQYPVSSLHHSKGIWSHRTRPTAAPERREHTRASDHYHLGHSQLPHTHAKQYVRSLHNHELNLHKREEHNLLHYSTTTPTTVTHATRRIDQLPTAPATMSASCTRRSVGRKRHDNRRKARLL